MPKFTFEQFLINQRQRWNHTLNTIEVRTRRRLMSAALEAIDDEQAIRKAVRDHATGPRKPSLSALDGAREG